MPFLTTSKPSRPNTQKCASPSPPPRPTLLSGRRAPASYRQNTNSSIQCLLRNASSSSDPPQNDSEASDAGAEDEPAEEENDDGDPLLSLFRVHNTNRVKFDLTCHDDDNVGQQRTENDDDESPTRKSSAKFRKFVRGASFTKKMKNGKSSSTPSNLTASCLLSKDGGPKLSSEDDVFVKKMMEPPAPFRKINALLGSVRGGGSSREMSTMGQTGLDKPPSPITTIEGIRQNADGSERGAANIPQSTKDSVARLLKKAQRAHRKTFRYRLAMKHYLLALREMTDAGYSDSEPLTVSVLKSLNDVHHAQSTVTNSANIVQMGIQHEDGNQLIKALKMYTVAYRMRRDSLGVDHPSLAVLLNMMGSVQVKRGEYGEAMKIYELSLRGRADENGGRGRRKERFRDRNPLTTR